MIVRIFSFLLFLIPLAAGAQKVNPAVQQGHFDEILLLALSHSEKTLATYGKDAQLVCWDLKTGMQLKRISINSEVNNIVFSSDDKIILETTTKFLELDVINNQLEYISAEAAPVFDQRKSQVIGKRKYIINGAIIGMYEDLILKRTHTSQYFDQGFTSVVANENCKYVFASALDGHIYVYDALTLKFVRTLRLHNSAVHSVILNKAGTVLYSTGRDRSVIEWDLATFKMKRRFYPHSFRITSLAFDKEGNNLYFGNELGDVKSFNMRSYSHELSSVKVSSQPVKEIRISPENDSSLLVLALENKIRELSTVSNKKGTYRRYHKSSFRFLYQGIFQNIFGFYAEPLFENYFLDYDKDKKLIVYHGAEKKNKIRRKIIVEKAGKRKRIRFTMNSFRDIEVINDTSFAVIPAHHAGTDEPFSLVLWKVRNKKLSSYTLNESLLPAAIESYGSRWLLVLYASELRVIDLKDNSVSSHSIKNTADGLWVLENYCFLSDQQNNISVYKISEEGDLTYHGQFSGHEARITSVALHPREEMMVTASEDATIRFWSLDEKELLVTLIPVNNNDFILVSPEGEYQITRKAFRTFGFSKGLDFFYPDQFDLRYNRPHKVLSEIGAATGDQLVMLEKAYLKRLKRMGFTLEDLASDVTLPELKLSRKKADPGFASFDITAADPQYTLDRINVYVNDVPVFGSAGIDLREMNALSWKNSIHVPLMSGKNKIEISVLNSAGVESLRQSDLVHNEEIVQPDLYIISIGVSDYADQRFNLSYAEKDAEDVASLFKNSRGVYSEVFPFVLTDQNVTREKILALKESLLQSKANDVIMIFVAGHGILDKDFNYYIATHDMDFDDPAGNGIAYEELEGILDGIPALRKILVIDACHSGEIDKEEVEELTAQNLSSGDIKFRTAGAGIRKKGVGLKTASELMSELFTDLRKGTGATVISSAGGVEYAMESEQWNNGLFTYCFLNGLTNKKADLDRDGIILLSELQQYLRTVVTKLSNGQQQPSSRMENISLDFQIW